MIDLHCHILPGIDDGPADLAGALALARAQVAVGVDTVAATPHVSPAFPGNDGDAIAVAVGRLRAALSTEACPLHIVIGAEVDLGSASELDDDELLRLRMGDGPYLLVEAPLTPATQGADVLLRHVRRRGHEILIAHPERCPDFQRRPEALRALVRDGMLTQITAGALVGRFGSRVARFAHWLVDEELVHDVSSDAHDAVRRAPGLRGELVEAALRDQAAWLTEEVPAAILAGEPIPARPAARRRPSPRRGLLQHLRRT